MRTTKEGSAKTIYTVGELRRALKLFAEGMQVVGELEAPLILSILVDEYGTEMLTIEAVWEGDYEE